MSWGLVAVGVGTAIGAVGSSMSADAQSDAALAAGDQSYALGIKNLEFQQEMLDQQRADFAPWRESGQQALTQLWQNYESGKYSAPTMDQLKADPGYQFRLQQGEEAMGRSAAARGGLMSGAQLKASQQYGQDMASQEYGNVYNRNMNDFNMLAGLSQQGQASAAGQAAATGQTMAQGANTMQGMGIAQGNALLGAGQAQAGGYRGMATAANQGIQNYLVNKNLGGGAPQQGDPNSFGYWANR